MQKKRRKYGDAWKDIEIDAASNDAVFDKFLKQPVAPPVAVSRVADSTIVESATVADSASLLWQIATVADSATVAKTATVKGFTKVPNELLDVAFRTLLTTDQSVLLRLFRLSHGFKSKTCLVGYQTLGKACNISKRQTQISVERLIAAGWIERLAVQQGGSNKAERGAVYRVILPAEISSDFATVADFTIAESATNKENTYKETHTHRKIVCVCSRFTLAECRKYADSLRADGITNPGGYATKIHRSGEADGLIEIFLTPSTASPNVDTSQCPDCHGTGFWYPQGKASGVAKCKHEKLKAT